MTSRDAEPLLCALAAGEQHAFAVLYERYSGRLYQTALRMLGRREDAEDAVQEVFMSVARSRARLIHVENLAAYLFTALRRSAGKISRRRTTGTNNPDAISSITDARSAAPANSHSERLERALSALPEEQREVISMKIEGQLTFAEIGEVMEISANTAASRYRYALEKLRTSLGNS